MRSFLSLLAILVIAPLLTACSGCGLESEPIVELKSPLWIKSRPVMREQGYAIAQPAQTQYVEVQRIQQAPAVYQYERVQTPRAVGPCGGQPDPTYNPPPVPGDDDVPESIPAARSPRQ